MASVERLAESPAGAAARGAAARGRRRSGRRRRARTRRARAARSRCAVGRGSARSSISARGSGAGSRAAAREHDVVVLDRHDVVALAGRRDRRRAGSSRNSCGGKRSVYSSERLTGSGGDRAVELEQRRSRRARRRAPRASCRAGRSSATTPACPRGGGRAAGARAASLGSASLAGAAIERLDLGQPRRRRRLAAPRAPARASSSKSTPNSRRGLGRIVTQQPVAQRERGAAVLLVVGADRLQQRVVAGLEPLLVGDDRAAALADRAARRRTKPWWRSSSLIE